MFSQLEFVVLEHSVVGFDMIDVLEHLGMVEDPDLTGALVGQASDKLVEQVLVQLVLNFARSSTVTTVVVAKLR